MDYYNMEDKMRSILSVIFLTLWLGMCVYLIIVGFLGAIYGEPLGFLFISLGIIVTIPHIQSFKES
jgi:uncharacterized membrane protein YoaK (UPF0700 family)